MKQPEGQPRLIQRIIRPFKQRGEGITRRENKERIQPLSYKEYMMRSGRNYITHIYGEPLAEPDREYITQTYNEYLTKTSPDLNESDRNYLIGLKLEGEAPLGTFE